MGFWNYRVLKKKWNEELTSYAVCEVYYDAEGKPSSWIWDKNIMNSYSYEELELNISVIQKAFEKPVLEIAGDDEFLIEI